MNDVMINNFDKKKFLKLIFVLILFFFGSITQLIPIKIFNMDINNLTATENILLATFSNTIVLSILIFIYRKDLKEDFKKLKNNVKTNKCSISKKNLLDTSTNFLDILDKFVFSFSDKNFDSTNLFDFFEYGKISENQEYYTEISQEEFEVMEDTKDILVVPHSNYIETITKLSKDNFDEYFENLIGWIDFKNLNPIYPGFIKYLDTSLYFMNEGECLVQFQIPFKHKKYE